MTSLPEVEPHWDERIQSMVFRETDDWIISVTPMIVNDRIMLTSRAGYPYSATAGWCYDKGGPAMLAAMVWNPETEREPQGYKKAAFDSRST